LNYFKTLEKLEIDDLTTFLLKVNGSKRLSDTEMETVKYIYETNYDYKSTDLKQTLLELEKIVISKNLANIVTCNLRTNGGLVADDSFRSSVSNAVEFKVLSEKLFWNFSNQEEIEEFIGEDYKLDIIPSKHAIINDCASNKGFTKGELVCVAASSGTGKTTSLVDESINFILQGKKVIYVTIGDMSARSMMLRFLTNFSGIPAKELRSNGWGNVYLEYRHHLDNLRSLVVDSGSADIRTLLNMISNKLKEFAADVVIIDYDQNIANPNGMSLYDLFGDIYMKAKGYATANNLLIFIASQVKIDQYTNELIGKEALCDSSKKVNNLDWLITFGVNSKNKTIGKMNLAKVRDGKSGMWSHVQYNNDKQRIDCVTGEDYNKILNDDEEEIKSYFNGE
jgi:hypothetical protein